MTSESTSFGDDAGAIWQLLQRVQRWYCIETSQQLAPALGRLIEQALSVPVRYLDDVHHTLTQPAPVIKHPSVRLLTLADVPMILAAHPDEDHAQLEWRLRYGAIAGAVVHGQLVATAQTYAMSAQYCDIGVHTHESHRRQGYSTACASLAARAAQQRGLTPVWSTGEDNHASLRVAAKLGFREVGRMTYVIPTFPSQARS
jgi:GNAT superfamily N-acetyltransferase